MQTTVCALLMLELWAQWGPQAELVLWHGLNLTQVEQQMRVLRAVRQLLRVLARLRVSPVLMERLPWMLVIRYAPPSSHPPRVALPLQAFLPHEWEARRQVPWLQHVLVVFYAFVREEETVCLAQKAMVAAAD